MKIKICVLTLAVCLFICSVFTACGELPKDNTQEPIQTTVSYDLLIRELEEKILELQQNQYISEAESEKLIKELKQEINELRNQAAQTTTPSQSTPSLPEDIFTYTVDGGEAIITGFTGKDEHIVIPATIDGVKVKGVAENAFKGHPLKSLIISNGIKYLDWFAFYNCTYLASVTIPSSVESIGYSAFDGCSKNLTIYCTEGSFAQRYAKSYGVSYAVI